MKTVFIMFKEKEKPKVKLEGAWKRVDVDKAYKEMLNALKVHNVTKRTSLEKK